MTTGCSLVQIASGIGSDEASEPFLWDGEVDLGRNFTLTQRSWFETPRTTATIRHFWLERVIFDPSWSILFHKNCRIEQSRYLIFDSQFDAIQVAPDVVDLEKAGGSFGLAMNNGHDNFYHWIAQCLPAAEACLRHRQVEDITLVLPELTTWQERALELLGFASASRLTVKAGQQYRFPRLVYSEYLNGSSSFQVSQLARSMFLRMSQAVNGTSEPPSEIIYVARTDSQQRVAVNENDLIEKLRAHGVQIVIPGQLSLDEQIRTFRRARLVIGPHGAGLANVVFCQEGANLYELFPTHYVNPCTYKLALGGGLNYFADCFDTLPTDIEWEHAKSWLIDVKRVLERVDQIRSQKRTPKSRNAGTSPALRDILMDFESLGDNCEFGLVQRQTGAEPISLLRFASPAIPIEQRPSFVTNAIATQFSGLGQPGTVSLDLAGEAGRREYILRESVYQLLYHTFKLEGEIDPDDFKEKETRRLGFLRRKLLSDLSEGEKIWVWKSNIDLQLEEIQKLLQTLRAAGPNTLLWVAQSDDHHPPGTAEAVEPDLIKGYVDRFAPYNRATQISFEPWFELCLKAHELWRTARRKASPISPAPWPALTQRQYSAIVAAIRLLAYSVRLSIVVTPQEENHALASELEDIFRVAGAQISLEYLEEPQELLSGTRLVLPALPTPESRAVFEALSRAGLISSVVLDSSQRWDNSAAFIIGGPPSPT